MIPYVLLRGGKKFCHLQLVKPNGAVTRIKGDATASVLGGVEYD